MLPEAFLEKMEALLGDEYEAFLAALDQPRAVGLRRNPLKAAVLPELPFRLEPVPWEPAGFSYDPEARPGLHPYHAAGLYYLQEPSAMAPAVLLAPQPGERVLDLCAAPGGKSTQIAGKMHNRGLLVCNEIHPKRAQILAGNIERLGIANALVLNEHPAKLAARFPAWFDRVLVDAPCSGEGMFRKHEAAGTDWSPETVAMCARRQAEILDAAAEMLRPGGRLVYSTCTFSPEEDEGTVEAFLRRHPDYEIVSTDAPWFSPGRPEWVPGGREALKRCIRLWPHRLTCEGHFAAVLTRTGGQPGSCPTEPAAELPKAAAELLRQLRIPLAPGKAVRMGERVFWAPEETPLLQGLRVLRPGLELAALRKDRAEPAHALALSVCEASAVRDLDAAEADAYLHGETLPTQTSGWTLVRFGGLGLGWGKGAGGTLKNHYPKGLRTLGAAKGR